MNKFKWQFHLWIHNCYRYSPLHGACSELLDCQLFLIYIEPWVVFPLVPHNLHPLLHIYHYF